MLLALLWVTQLLLAQPAGTDHRGAEEDASREVELARLRQEIARLDIRVRAMRQREQGLDSTVRRVAAELELQQRQLEEASAALALVAQRAATTHQRVQLLEGDVLSLRDDLRRRLVGLYKLGHQGYLRLFLSVGPSEDLLPAIRQLRFMAFRDRQVLSLYSETRDRLAAERERLRAEVAEAEGWRDQEQQRRDQLADMRRQHQRLLRRVERERRQLEAESSELNDRALKLAKFIEVLVSGNGAALAGAPIDGYRGVLDWPVRGQVTGEFGPRLDPRYGTEVPHNGVEISTGLGSRVRAVFPGRVVFADRFEGYGPMVVLHHPERVFTLYAGLGQVLVTKGDVVSLGGMLGTATDRLYFEIRNEQTPEDPRRWLR